MQTIAEYLPEHPFFAGLDDEAIDLVTGCAVNVHLRPGAYLFREGEPADTFYVIRSGRVAIQMRLPTDGVVVSTPPTTATSSAGRGWCRRTAGPSTPVATEETSVVAFDGACLRGKCEADPALGYALLQRVVQVMSTRLHSARVRLLDLYGTRT